MSLWRILILGMIIVSCSNGTTLEETPTDYPKDFNLSKQNSEYTSLLKANRVVPLDAETITATFAAKGSSAKANNGIHIYSIVFNSQDIDGTPTVESGLVMIPDTENPKPVTALFHGTTVGKAGAPTANPSSEGVLEAAMGFVVIIPDYQGYGASSNKIHFEFQYLGPSTRCRALFASLI